MSDKTSNVIEEIVALNGNANPLSSSVLAAVKDIGKASGQMSAAKTNLVTLMAKEGLTSWTLAVAKGWADAEKQEAHTEARLKLYAEACTARGSVIDPTTGEKTFPTHPKHGSAGKTFLKFPTADEREANLTPSECVMFDRVLKGAGKGDTGVEANMTYVYIRLQRAEIKAYADTVEQCNKLLNNPKTKAKAKKDAQELKDETIKRLSSYPPSRLKETLGKNNPIKTKRKKSKIDEESIKTEVLNDLGSVRERTGDVDHPWWKENVGADDELREELQALLDRDSFVIAELRDLVFARYGVLDQDDGSDDS